MELIINEDLDFEFLKSNITTKEELALVNPSAKLPFDDQYWRSFFLEAPLSDPAFSLYFKMDEKVFAHAALKKFSEREGRVYLCFVYLEKSYRGQGLSTKIYQLLEAFLQESFSVSEYWLNVRSYNKIAIGSYEKFGFVVKEQVGEQLRMVKYL